MLSQMACWKVSRPTLLIPYGLKSLLESLCRAIRTEDPQHIKHFIAAYCTDLLEHRDQTPSRDLKQVIQLYQKIREHDRKNCPMRGSPDAAQVPVPSGEPAEMYQNSFSNGSVSLVSCHLADDALADSQSMHVQSSLAPPESFEDLPAARVQSAVFQRVPSRTDLTETKGTVLIDSARAPPADVIVVHSENLPGTIVFHCDSRPSSASSVRSCGTRTPSVTDTDGTEECGLEMHSDGMVVFERVPSKEDFLPLQSSVEVESSELQNSEIVDEPRTTVGRYPSSEEMEEQHETQKVAATQESSKIKKVSPRRSLVKVFSAHMVTIEDSLEKMDDGSKQSDGDMSPSTSSETSITECPSEPTMNDIRRTGDIEGPIIQATDSEAEPDSHLDLVISNDLSDVSGLKETTQMAAAVDMAALTDKLLILVQQMSEECLAEAEELLSSESLPNQTERDTAPGLYSETVFVSEMPQTGVSVSESASPLCTVEREETAAQEQSVEEHLIAAAAGVSVLPAECSGTDRAESIETADVVTMENSPHKSLEESVVSVTPVRSPIQMDMNEIADADGLDLFKEIPESLAENSELSPEEMLGLPSDQTSATGGECPNTADTGFFITSGGIPCQEESSTDRTTSIVSSETSEISQTDTSVFVDRGERAAQEPSVEETLNAATAVAVAPAEESVVPPEWSGSDNSECLETVQNVLKDDMVSVLSKHSGVNIDATSASEPVDNVTPIKSSIQENMSETADADDLVEGMPESLADYFRLSPFRQEEHEETADSPDEHIVLTSPADEDGTKVTYTECITCDRVKAETALQEPFGDDALCAAESVLPGDNNTDCPETGENVLQKDVESVSPRYSGTDITERLASEPIEDNVDNTSLVSSLNDENMSEITETATATAQSQTLQTDLSPTLSPDAFPESEVPQTDTIVVDWTLDTGLDREEAKAQQPSGDGALSVSPVANEETDSSVVNEETDSSVVNEETDSSVVNEETDSPEKGSFLNRPIEYSKTETFERLEIAEIDVPLDIELVSVGCSRDITEGSLCHSAEDTIDHRESSPTGSSLETTNEITETDDHVSHILEPPPFRKGLSEERMTSELSVDTPAQVFTASEGNPDKVVTISTGHIPSARIPTQEEDVSISRGTTDRGASPIFPPNTSSVSGCVHASTQVSDISVLVTAKDTEGNQSPASGNHLPGPPCSGNETETPQNERAQAEEQQQHTPDSVAERGTMTPFDSPVLKGSVNQMWTLYHLPHTSEEEGTLCTNILSQPPFNGRAYIHAFGPGHVLLAERSPQHSSLDLRQTSEGLVEGTIQASDLHQALEGLVEGTTQASDQHQTSEGLVEGTAQASELHQALEGLVEGTTQASDQHQALEGLVEGTTQASDLHQALEGLVEGTAQASDLHQALEGLVEGTAQASDQHQHRAQDVAPTAEAACSVHPSAPPLPDSGTQEISLPNYLLCIDDSTKQVMPLMGSPGGPDQAVRVRRDDASGQLSLTFPSAVLSGAHRTSGQAQFLQITTDQGQTVYSPAVLRIVTHPADQN